MSLYRVVIKEVHNQFIWVEANSVNDAVKKVERFDGQDFGDGPEYAYTLDSDEWGVDEETEQSMIDRYKEWQGWEG